MQSERGARSRAGHRTSAGIGSAFLAPVALACLLIAAPLTQGAAGHTPVRLVAPYRGSASPSDVLWEADCGKAVQPKPATFDLRSGSGGASLSASTRPCHRTAFRSGNDGVASVNDTLLASIALPHALGGFQNLTANVSLSWKGDVREADGTGQCPGTASRAASASYFNGTSWSYGASIARPLVLSNLTYYRYHASYGAQGRCAAGATINGTLSGELFGANGTPAVALTPASVTFVDAYVLTEVATSWSCANTTLWTYGAWSNSTRHCTNANTTVTTTSVDFVTGSTGSNSTLGESGSAHVAFAAHVHFSSSPSWLLEFIWQASVSADAAGWTKGSASAYLDMDPAMTGLGWSVSSIVLR